MRSPAVVTVYSRQRCGLCRDAEKLVRVEARGHPIRVVDVDTDEGLVVRFGVRVPVILVEDREIAELQVAPGTVRRALRSLPRERRSGPVSRLRHVLRWKAAGA